MVLFFGLKYKKTRPFFDKFFCGPYYYFYFKFGPQAKNSGHPCSRRSLRFFCSGHHSSGMNVIIPVITTSHDPSVSSSSASLSRNEESPSFHRSTPCYRNRFGNNFFNVDGMLTLKDGIHDSYYVTKGMSINNVCTFPNFLTPCPNPPQSVTQIRTSPTSQMNLLFNF